MNEDKSARVQNALFRVLGVFYGAALSAVVCLSAPAQQPVVPSPAIDQFEQVMGNRAEAAIILGGDYGAAGGIYSFRGGKEIGRAHV